MYSWRKRSEKWNPEAEEIIGGYRYLFGRNWRLNADGQPELRCV